MLGNGDPVVLHEDDREIIIFLLEIVRELHAWTNGAIYLSDNQASPHPALRLAFLG